MINEKEDLEESVCKAFPNGIPYEVYSRMSIWNPPANCNNGIGFKPDVPYEVEQADGSIRRIE